MGDEPHDLEKGGQGKKPVSVHNGSGEFVTIFHKPTRHSLNVSLNSPQKQVTLVFKDSDQVVNLDFDDKFWNEVKKTQISLQDEGATGEDASLKSIDELIWKPTKLDVKKLGFYYMNLSKIRLTGKF